MICQVARELIPQLMDGELEGRQRQELERHLQSCVNCAEAVDRAAILRDKIRGDAPYFSAPEVLTGRVREALRREKAVSRRWTPPAWWQTAASIAAILVLAIFVWNRHQQDTRNTLANEVVTAHVRAMLPGHLIDVPSTDRHTVKPWFDGKLDFAPRVEDLTAKGFELKGGRLDYLHGRTAAALVFGRRQHVIDLFISPGEGAAARLSIKGYNVIEWTDAGMSYWAISDLNAVELSAFVDFYRTAP